MSTIKKVKIIGTQDYINHETGELVSMQVTTVEERDFNFTKVWMRDFLAKLDILGGAKFKVALWIVEHINRDNQLLYTYQEIAKNTECSMDTVAKTMKMLIEVNLLKRKNHGHYIVNPDTLFKGGRSARLNALTQYREAGTPENSELTDEQKLQSILKAIGQLTEQAKKIQDKINAKSAGENNDEERTNPARATI